MAPRTAADFEILFNELEAWRLQETRKIKGAGLAKEQEAQVLAQLLSKEAKLLQVRVFRCWYSRSKSVYLFHFIVGSWELHDLCRRFACCDQGCCKLEMHLTAPDTAFVACAVLQCQLLTCDHTHVTCIWPAYTQIAKRVHPHAHPIRILILSPSYSPNADH